MEILIIGLIVVALMVYASTKIKKSAARALEREVIDNADFSIVKPNGFVHVLNGDPGFEFEAYSKDFGKDGTEDVRQVTAKIRLFENAAAAQIANETRDVLSEAISEGKYISGLKSEKDAVFEVCHKIIAKNGDVFDLEVSVLHDHAEDQKENVHELLDSFRIK